MQRNLLLATAVASAIALGVTALHVNQWASMPDWLPTVLRWMALAVMCGYGVSKRSLTPWIVIAMFIGMEVGHDFPAVAKNLDVISKAFMKLIKTIVAPLLFGTLVVGIAGHSNIGQVGRMGLKSLIYFEVVTTVALFVGLAAINFTQAGVGVKKEETKKYEAVAADSLTFELNAKDKLVRLSGAEGQQLQVAPSPVKQDWKEILLHSFPDNIAKAVSEGQVLQIVVFSILFAVGLSMVQEPYRRTMLDFAESLTEVMFKFTHIVMYAAPFAVGAAIAVTIGDKGFGVMVNLGKLLATTYLALIAFVALVLLPIAWAIGLPLGRFIKAVSEPASLAFATASSEAALPKALENMEKFGVPRKIVSFVIPTGYSFNLDGTTLYLALASVFVAQAAGITLSLGEQITIVLALMLTSKGVAGVPRASLVILTGMAATFDLPEWPITGLILAIDALMDMARTSVNVIGNCLASAVIAKWEGELNINEQEQ
jgi:proton glutamate symport protein